MGFFSRLFGRSAAAGTDVPPASGDDQHALLLAIRLADDEFGDPAEVSALHALQDRIEAAVVAAGAGELDGDEFGGGYCTVFLYGPDADRLWEAAAPVLEPVPLRKGSHAIKRYGGPGVGREERIDLRWDG